jgi:hypothetical protein
MTESRAPSAGNGLTSGVNVSLGADGEQNAITALLTIDSKVEGWQVN